MHGQYPAFKTNTGLDLRHCIYLLYSKSKTIPSIETKNFVENFPCTMSGYISNYWQTGSGCTADLKIAYTLQLNMIKLWTKYKIIPFHRSQENFDEKFSLYIEQFKFQTIGKLYNKVKSEISLTQQDSTTSSASTTKVEFDDIKSTSSSKIETSPKLMGLYTELSKDDSDLST